jgi:FAD/FMN-containing dehydrogenase
VAEQAKMVQMIASEHGGTDFSWATKREDRDKLWRARHDVVYADKALREGAQFWATDVCVPISRLAECITETQKDVAASFYRLRSLAMPATAIFTSASCSIQATRERWRRLNGSTNEWSIGRYCSMALQEGSGLLDHINLKGDYSQRLWSTAIVHSKMVTKGLQKI